jgi:hypothetical protein
MLPLRLESSSALPPALRCRLMKFSSLFRKHEYLDAVLENREIRALADELETHLIGQRIHAYHCSKEPDTGFFERQGLASPTWPCTKVSFFSAIGTDSRTMR